MFNVAAYSVAIFGEGGTAVLCLIAAALFYEGMRASFLYFISEVRDYLERL